MNRLINGFIEILTGIPLKVWAVIALVAFILAMYWYANSWKNQAEIEKKRGEEAVSTDRVIRIDEAKEEVNKASENVNAVKNANYQNVNNDELRRRIIEAARRQK